MSEWRGFCEACGARAACVHRPGSESREARTVNLRSALLGGALVLVCGIAIGGGAGDASSLVGGIYDRARVSVDTGVKNYFALTRRGSMEVGGSTFDGSVVPAHDQPAAIGGNDPAGLRQTIAVASDGAVAITTSDAGDFTVDVRNMPGVAADGATALPASDVVIAGIDRSLGSGVVRAIAVSTDGAVAITDSGDTITVDGTAGTALQQGAGANTAATLRATLGTDDPAVVALQIMDDWDQADRAAVNPIAGQVGVQGGAGASTALTQRVSVATDDVVTIDGTAGTAVQQGAGASTAATLRVGVATDDAVSTSLTNIATDTNSLLVVGGGAEATALRVTVANDSTGVLSVDDNGGSFTVDAPLATPVAVQIGDTVDTANVTAAGELNVIASAQPGVDVGDVTINNAAGAAAVNVQDGGNSFTVDAPVGTPVFMRLSDGAAPQGTTVNPLFTRISDSADDQVAVTAAGELNVIATAQPGVDIGDVTVNNAGGGAAVNVQDGGNSLTVDSAQLPAALVGGRLDVVVGAALPAGAANIGDVDVLTLPSLVAGTALIGSVLSIPSSDFVMSAGTQFLVQTAFTNFVTNGAEERLIVAAQGAGNSIAVLGWIVTTDNAVKVRFEDAAAGTARSLPVRLAADGAGWTSDYSQLWFETADNQGLELDTNATMTGAVQVWYIVR